MIDSTFSKVQSMEPRSRAIEAAEERLDIARKAVERAEAEASRIAAEADSWRNIIEIRKADLAAADTTLAALRLFA